MALCTLEEAKQHLADWLAADSALATGKSYQLDNGLKITRADIKTVKDRIAYWYDVVKTLEAKGGAGTRPRKFRRVIPLDT